MFLFLIPEKRMANEAYRLVEEHQDETYLDLDSICQPGNYPLVSRNEFMEVAPCC